MARRRSSRRYVGPTIPVVKLPADAVGGQGLTIPGKRTDAGGGQDPGGRVVPVVRPRCADERQWCVQVSLFVHDGVPPNLGACKAYRGGRCALAGGDVLCAFHEAEDADVWTQAGEWRFVPGTGFVPRSLWAEFGIE